MRRLIYLCVALFAFTNTCFSDFNPSLLQNQNVMVQFEDTYGSGVLVTRKIGEQKYNFVITCSHTIDEAKKIVKSIDTGVVKENIIFKQVNVIKENFKNNEPSIIQTTSSRIVLFNEEYDISVLMLDVFLYDTDIVFYANESINVGTEAIHVGNFKGELGFNSVSTGVISHNNRIDEGQKFLQISNTVYQGSSGGGVYNKDNEYVGMVSHTFGENFNYAIPIVVIKDVLKRGGYEFLYDKSISVDSVEDIKKLPIEVDKTEVQRLPTITIPQIPPIILVK